MDFFAVTRMLLVASAGALEEFQPLTLPGWDIPSHTLPSNRQASQTPHNLKMSPWII